MVVALSSVSAVFRLVCLTPPLTEKDGLTKRIWCSQNTRRKKIMRVASVTLVNGK